MLMYKQKKSQGQKGNRLLITVNVIGSAGPIRFVVNEEDLVSSIIETALKYYAREGRLPVLGSDTNDFVLYCPHAASEALNPLHTIGSIGARNFMLCKKPGSLRLGEAGDANNSLNDNRKASGSWRAWINKSFNPKVASH